MTKTITLPRNEYRELKEKALRYETIRKLIEAEFFAPPVTRNVGQIVIALRKTGRYPDAFLKSLARGLRESSYFSRSLSR